MELDGSRTISDRYLEQVFDKIVSEGLLLTVFGGIELKTAQEFIRMMKYSGNLPVFVMDDTECIGFAWLNGIATNHAYGHFCYFDNDHYSSEFFGHLILEYWWSLKGKSGPLLEVILGSIPSFNRLALGYILKMGFTRVGEIPNVYIDLATGKRFASTILYMVRPNEKER